MSAAGKPTGTLPLVPTYEYTCRDCGHTFEIVQSMSDDPLTMCPECGGGLRKVFAPPAIAFRGSGFYATDHGKKSKETEGDKGDKAERPEKKGGGRKDGADRKDATTSASSTGSDGKAAPAKKEPAAP